MQDEFEKLKAALMEDVTIQLPDFAKPFTLYMDASGFAIGAILTQKGDGDSERVVAYA